ncbi:MAG: hypothetical protein AAGD14_03075 [Planctomycetota bacterium]
MSGEEAHERSWRIPSQNGWFECVATLLDRPTPECFLAAVRVTEMFWDRRDEVKDAPYSNLVTEQVTSLEQVVISRARLTSLHRKLEEWQSEPSEVDEELSDNVGATLRLSIGDSDDKITTRHKPALALRYEHASTSMSWQAVLDPTCIRELSEGIATWLEESGQGRTDGDAT